jgi:hypothetical protein
LYFHEQKSNKVKFEISTTKSCRPINIHQSICSQALPFSATNDQTYLAASSAVAACKRTACPEDNICNKNKHKDDISEMMLRVLITSLLQSHHWFGGDQHG